MTPEEIRASTDLTQAIYLREMAAQMAEMNEWLKEIADTLVLIFKIMDGQR